MNTSKMRSMKDSKSVHFLVAIEMSLKHWRLAMTCTSASKHRQVSVTAGDFTALLTAVQEGRRKFKTARDVPTVFCYEAGREGFYPYRRLTEWGHAVWVIESSSIEVKRRSRRAKTDSIDAEKLLQLMVRHIGGEADALHLIRIPTLAVEDQRQRSRERDELRCDRTRLQNRMRGLVYSQGFREWNSSIRGIRHWLSEHATTLLPLLRTRLEHEFERLQLVDAQLKAIDRELKAVLVHVTSRSPKSQQCAERLTRLNGIAALGATILANEVLSWRDFHNRREVGSALGLTPTPYSSGESEQEQGISKAGNRRARRLIIELAWKWLKYQADSALARWYQTKFAGHGRRLQRIGIVALARRLAIALWHYVAHGVVPEGATLKA